MAYVKSGKFEDYFVKINKQIQDISNCYSQKTDEFGLTWNESEKLEKIYFQSIGRLFSKHPRQKDSAVILHHFWVYIT
ncbi:Uncharacterized protein dnl_16100 [Desulfonema limicola]|uniref:Uncharacterized protein n=1 Tax=Desulfonema limicola TaxID=45656 RepID=A0A975GFI9_9BACT|nr:Uncharacterized protein dnl_16100 [Desulfonema limicola]